MLTSKIGSRNASDVVVEIGLALAVLGAVMANPSIVFLPATYFFGFASVALPFVALAALSSKKTDAVTGVSVVVAILLTEVWCYFLFKLAYHAQFGAEFVLPVK